MCGRFAVDSDTNELIEEFVVSGGNYANWQPSWNIAPTQQIPLVVESLKTGTLERRLELASWSLVPSWSKTPTLDYPTFNARAETAAEKPTFKAAVASKRAIVPATGYYEWHTEGEGASAVKTPYFIYDNDATLALAALYSWWKNEAVAPDAPGHWVLTACILTMPAVPELAQIHDRNPVPLPREFWSDWLNPALVGDQSLVDAAVQASTSVATALEYHEVAPLQGDSPELMEPA